MKPLRLIAPAFAIAFAVTACAPTGERADSVSDDLQRDLQQVGASGLDLAPNGGRGQQIISAIEQSGKREVQAAPRVAAPRVAEAAPVQQPQEDAPAPVTPERAEETPAALQQPIPARRPQPVSPARGGNGRYKTVGEVIRDAPFPINP